MKTRSAWVVLTLLLVGCNRDDDSGTPSGTAAVGIRGVNPSSAAGVSFVVP